MIHEILPVGMLECNCSIFGDEGSHEAIVVDPGDNIDGILKILAKHGLKVKAIVITHAHIDHIGGAAKLKKATGRDFKMPILHLSQLVGVAAGVEESELKFKRHVVSVKPILEKLEI